MNTWNALIKAVERFPATKLRQMVSAISRSVRTSPLSLVLVWAQVATAGQDESIQQANGVRTPSDVSNPSEEIDLILKAICTGDLPQLKKVLRVPEHHSLRSTDGKTLLHVAAECGHAAIVDCLLECGWPVNVRAGNQEMPLHLAGRARILGGGEWLSGEETSWDPRQPAHSPAIEEAILQLIRSRGMSAPAAVGEIDDLPEAQRSPLYDAVLELMDDRARLHRLLSDAGIFFDPYDPTFKFVRLSYPDYLNVVELLVARGADVNSCDASGQSPLHVAISSSISIAEYLLRKGADPNLKLHAHGRWYSSPMEDALEFSAEAAALLHRFGGRLGFDDNYPLHRAAGNGQLKLLLWLLEAGGNINQTAPDGDTPLLRAAEGHVDVIAALCEGRADLNVINVRGQGVLHRAACWAPALKLFAGRGLNVNARDKGGLTPLHYAARGSSEDTVPLLLSEGALVNAQDVDGNTPLHLIFFGEELRPDIEFSTFKALVDGGADRSIRNSEGNTPYDLARKYRYPAEYLELLLPQ